MPSTRRASPRPVRLRCRRRFDEATSDIDVLVEFAGGPGFDYFGAYFALKDGLEEIFGRPVYVVSATAIRNPYFRDEVMRTREPLYAA